MGVASQTNAKSVVETSESSCNHYQFSSINKAIASIFDEGAKTLELVMTAKVAAAEKAATAAAAAAAEVEAVTAIEAQAVEAAYRTSRQKVAQEFLDLKKDYLPVRHDTFWLINTDISSLFSPSFTNIA